MGTLRRVLADAGPRLGAALPPNYWRFFCDRLLRSFAPRFHEAVLRCRKISDAGAQQLRLDAEVGGWGGGRVGGRARLPDSRTHATHGCLLGALAMMVACTGVG